MLVDELIPKVDVTYRTKDDSRDRALAGLSMGGMQALQIGLKHLDQFAIIGAFIAPPLGGFDVKYSFNGAFRDANAFNEKIRLFWIGAGTAEERFAAHEVDLPDGPSRDGLDSGGLVSDGQS